MSDRSDQTNASHAQAVDDVLKALWATADGLSSAEATTRLKSYGPNQLPEAPRRWAVLRFLAHFHNVLIGAAVVRW